MSEAFVIVDELHVDYSAHGRRVPAVRGVSFHINRGASYGLVGESGSGKSTIAMTLVGPLDSGMKIEANELTVSEQSVLTLSGVALCTFRIETIGVVYQDTTNALNPTMTVGNQVAEVFLVNGARRGEARRLAIDALDSVELADPALLARRYPHELSGGQQQRVVIAMALASKPDLLLLDEPTTGLDSQVEAGIFALIADLRSRLHFATLLISHNLPLVAAHCDTVGVLKDGELVEAGSADSVIRSPRAPYTQELVRAVPSLNIADRAAPLSSEPMVMVSGVSKSYGTKLAVNNVSFTIARGESLGIVGESGSGKSTLGRIVAGLARHDGTVSFGEVAHGPRVQMVFQNPESSLNPRRTVRQTLSRSISLLAGTSGVDELAESVGIPPELLARYPRELSGGQKQRVAIARAFAGPVPLVICDELTSALDVSVQALVLDLLIELQERTDVAYLFISHDLAVVRRMSHRIGVMKRGEMVELQTTNRIFEHPEHPYTRSLVAAARELRPRGQELASPPEPM